MGLGSAPKLLVQIGAEISDFEKDVEKAFEVVKKQSKKIEDFGKSLSLYVTAPALAAGVAFVKMAADEEASAARLKSSLTLAGVAFATAKGPIDAYITALERASGFDDSSISDALSNLTNTSNNAKLSVQALQVTLDLARAKQMDLGSASTLVGKALIGNTEALKKYGIQLRDGAKGTEVIEALTRKFGGTSATFMQSAAGALANLKNQVSNAAEAWGNVLMPVALKIVNVLTMMAEGAQRLASWFGHLSPDVQALVGVFASLVVAAGPALVFYAKMLTLIPKVKAVFAALQAGMVPTVAGLLFLAAIGLVIAANWEKTKALLASAFYLILMGFTKLVEGIVGAAAWLTQKVPLLGRLFGDLKDKVTAYGETAEEKFLASASAIDKGGSWIGNTTKMVGDGMTKLMGILGLTGKEFGNLAGAQKTAADAMDGTAQVQLSMFQLWGAEMTKTSKSFADSMTSSFANMTGHLVATLASGTGDAKQILISFLISSLESIIAWAVTSMLAAEGLSAALAAAMSNPYVALVVIGAMIALVAGLSGSFSSRAMATGGIVTGPTNALVGEAGPEAVIPLSSGKAGRFLEGMGGSSGQVQNITVVLDSRVIARATAKGLPSVLRLEGAFR